MARSTSRFSRYSPVERTHRGVNVKDLISSEEWATVSDDLSRTPSKLAIIPAGYEGRPDLLAYKIYGDSELWWAICAANNIVDPLEQLVAGKQIIVPLIR